MAGSVYAGAPLPPTATAAVKALLLPLYLPCFFDSMAMGIIGPTLPLFALQLGSQPFAPLGVQRLPCKAPALQDFRI